MKALLALVAGLVASAAASAATPPRNPHDRAAVERYIRECEAEWASISTGGDPAVQRAFLADDYRGVSIGGKLLDKAQMLAADAGVTDLVSDRMDYVHVRFPAPGVAIAQGTETAVKKDGSRQTAIWTDTWLLRAGRWQIVASHDSLLR